MLDERSWFESVVLVWALSFVDRMILLLLLLFDASYVAVVEDDVIEVVDVCAIDVDGAKNAVATTLPPAIVMAQ